VGRRQWWIGGAVIGVPALVALLLTWPLALWDTLEKRYGGGAWDWVERSSWFATIIPALVLFFVWLRRQKADRVGATPTPPMALVPVADLRALLNEPASGDPETGRAAEPSGDRVINQHDESLRLTTALSGDRSAVIMVHGEPGVGKTVLVEDVLRRLGLDRPEAVRRYRLTAHGGFSVKALLQDIEGVVVDRQPGQDVLSRLTAVLHDPRPEPVVVWVDNAQFLVDSTRHHFRNLGIEEALTIVARSSARPVKVVLAMESVPRRSQGVAWPSGMVQVAVGHLDPVHFGEYLSRLENAGPIGLDRLDQARLYQVLRGVPRLADLFFAALRPPGDPRTGPALMTRLAAQNPEHVEAALAQQIIEGLNPRLLRVVSALVAFGTPVPLSLVVALLDGRETAESIHSALTTLRDAGVVSTTTGSPVHLFSGERLYHVLHEAIRKAADNVPGGPAALFARAAGLVQDLLSPPADARDVEELDLQFAVLRIWLNAEEWAVAFELINLMHDALARWRATDLLIPARTRLTGRLPNADDEMRNANALGFLYLARGETREAREAFERAVNEAAKTNRQKLGLSRIYRNMADLHWQDKDVIGAEDYFRKVLGLAEEQSSVPDQMAALAGLAECHRFWGNHAEAIRLGRDALSLAMFEQLPAAASVAANLARWYSEMEMMPEASAMLEEAVKQTRRFEGDHPLLTAQRWDAQADLALDMEEYEAALSFAEQAVATALDQYDATTVLQARTTLGWAYLLRGKIEKASVPVDGAMLYRREGRGLTVLGLHALIELRSGRKVLARASFDTLRNESSARWANDGRNFAAAEFEGLALAGAHALRGSPLRPAVEAFGRARAAVPVPAPRLRKRLQYMLGLLAPEITPENLDVLRAAAAGTSSSTSR
jgi:tetratricopeptide (TPR) repeat protein